MTDDLTTTWTELLAEHLQRGTSGRYMTDLSPADLAAALVASSALKAHTDEAVEAAVVAARDDIKARIDTFRSLDADPQYMDALNDAWGLVANRVRAAAQPETESTIEMPAHHVVGADLGFTCTNCGGHTSLTPPCIPAKKYPAQLVTEESR